MANTQTENAKIKLYFIVKDWNMKCF